MYSTEEGLKRTLRSNANISKTVIKGYTINYLEVGEGEPLLLIHGANFGWGIWYPNIDHFSKQFKVFAIDLPGADRSTKIDYSDLDLQKDFIEVVSEFIEQNVRERLSIVDCSAGGWIATKMALLFPKRINKVFFLNTFGFADYFSLSDIVSKKVLKPVRSNKKVEMFLRGIFFDKDIKLRNEFIDYFYDTMKESHNLLFI